MADVQQKPISITGTLSTSLGKIYSPSINQRGELTNIKFSNTANTAWQLWVYKIVSGQTEPVLLYHIELDAGDWVNDDTQYDLNSGDQIQAYSDVSTVQYDIEGLEKAINSSGYGNFKVNKA